MAKRSIDELLAALEAIDILNGTVAKHDDMLTRIVAKLRQLEERVAALEKAERS